MPRKFALDKQNGCGAIILNQSDTISIRCWHRVFGFKEADFVPNVDYTCRWNAIAGSSVTPEGMFSLPEMNYAKIEGYGNTIEC